MRELLGDLQTYPEPRTAGDKTTQAEAVARAQGIAKVRAWWATEPHISQQGTTCQHHGCATVSDASKREGKRGRLSSDLKTSTCEECWRIGCELLGIIWTPQWSGPNDRSRLLNGIFRTNRRMTIPPMEE